MPMTYGIKLDSKLVSNIDGLISLLRDPESDDFEYAFF